MATPHAGNDEAAAMLTRQAPTTYIVEAGDTLSAIALRLGTSVEALVEANRLADPDHIAVGQALVVPSPAVREGPAVFVIPDSELVYGPAYVGFDTVSFIRHQGGYLATYQEVVGGETLSGASIVDRVAREFLVGPRALLAFLEACSGWVRGVPTSDQALNYPAGLVDPSRMGLWRQLNWLADNLNRGYYNARTRDDRTLAFADGNRLLCPPAVGAGSCAVHFAMAQQSSEGNLVERLTSVREAYWALFGEPKGSQAPESRTAFPPLALPFGRGERWWFTGGPHGGWADGSAWAAIDLVPDEDQRGCYLSSRPARALAAGVVVDVQQGSLWLDLDGDGHRETGPAVFYLHLTVAPGVRSGLRVAAGDILGYPSCEGGVSSATHLHLARAWDGEWLPAAGTDPLQLSGWRVLAGNARYEGSLQHEDGRLRRACECREPGYNDISW